jgi:hypothetical protein
VRSERTSLVCELAVAVRRRVVGVETTMAQWQS